MDSAHWTGSEKKLAKAAYDTALLRELDALLSRWVTNHVGIHDRLLSRWVSRDDSLLRRI